MENKVNITAAEIDQNEFAVSMIRKVNEGTAFVRVKKLTSRHEHSFRFDEDYSVLKQTIFKIYKNHKDIDGAYCIKIFYSDRTMEEYLLVVNKSKIVYLFEVDKFNNLAKMYA